MTASSLAPGGATRAVERPIRVALLCDFPEENWPSMDLVAEMLTQHLQARHSATIQCTRVCPAMIRRFGSLPGLRNRRAAWNADRLTNRFWDYPRRLRNVDRDAEVFHIADHSYSQLIHELPPERTIVTCHDLDTFRSILEPYRVPRSFAFRAMTKRILAGFRKAAIVTCGSDATRRELLAHKLFDPVQLRVVRYGVHPDFKSQPDIVADREAAALLGPWNDDRIDLLHVGSTIPRKRVDFLLRVFGLLKREFPAARLIRVGGDFTPAQRLLVEQLGLGRSVVVLPRLSTSVLASVYRRAALVLQTSSFEGFGLPLTEAMSCGTPVVATDIPVFREVGGDAIAYCELNNLSAWREAITRLLGERKSSPGIWQARQMACVSRASEFSWAAYAGQMAGLYSELASRG